MNKMTCPHVNVFPPEAGDLFGIYEVPMNIIINRISKTIEAINRQVNHKSIDKFICSCVYMWEG